MTRSNRTTVTIPADMLARFVWLVEALAPTGKTDRYEVVGGNPVVEEATAMLDEARAALDAAYGDARRTLPTGAD